MRIFFTLGSIAGVVIGARHFLNYLNEQRKSRISAQRLEVWEAEGGAVPVHHSRTAQQVSPRRVSGASSHDVN
jgi:hypothetical protein